MVAVGRARNNGLNAYAALAADNRLNGPKVERLACPIECLQRGAIWVTDLADASGWLDSLQSAWSQVAHLSTA